MYEKGQKIPISKQLQMFDLQSAFAVAKLQALHEFGATEEGYMNKVKDFSRKTDSLVLQFKTVHEISNMGGVYYIFDFVASVESI